MDKKSGKVRERILNNIIYGDYEKSLLTYPCIITKGLALQITQT